MKDYTLKLSGKLSLKHGSAEMEKRIQEAVNSGFTLFVIDLTDVSYIDSDGLGALATCYSAIVDNGGFVALTGLCPATQHILDRVAFLNFFKAYRSREEALNNLRLEAMSKYNHKVLFSMAAAI